MLMLVLLVLLHRHALCFNLDVNHAQVLEDPAGDAESYFGYSLTFYKNSLLVGAPKADDKFHSDSKRPGVVYRCDVTQRVCSQIKLTNATAEEKEKVLQNDSWMGSAIAAHESRGILVCGRQIKETEYKTEFPPNGGCYLKKNIESDEDSKLLVPLFVGNYQVIELNHSSYFYYQHGQAGMSAVMTKDGNEIVLGAPGFGTGVGTLLRYHYDEESQEFTKTPPEPRTIITQDGLYQYMGYAVASGNFVYGKEAFVGGAPRADRGKGKVVLMTPSSDTKAWNKLESATGQAMGDGYGSSLAAADINGDGFDDLLVGAPRAGEMDAGRVYVYLGSSKILNFEDPKKIDGEAPWMQFGTTVATIGDINQDGCQDFAVGVPFDGDGVVYVYLGDRGSNGFRMKTAQRIAAADLGGFSASLGGFGISFAGGKDIDGNGVTDVAVGSFLSGHVVLLRSRPPLLLVPFFSEPLPMVPINASSVDVSVCLSYYNGTLKKPVAALITVGEDVKVQVTLFENPVCSNVTWNITDNWFFAPIQLTARASLEYRVEDSSTEFCQHCPVADPDSPVASAVAFYASECKNSSACSGDIYITAEFINVNGPVTISPNTLVSVRVTIRSTANSDPAHMVSLNMMFSSRNVKVREPANCQQNSGGTFDCPTLSSLVAGNEIVSNVVLDVSDIPAGTQNLMLNISVNSRIIDSKPENNIWTRPLDVHSKADATVLGDSDKPFIDFNEMEVNHTRTLSAEHTFEVQNKGPALIEKVTIVFSIPSEIKFKDTYRRIIKIQRPDFTDLHCTHLSGPEFSLHIPNVRYDIAEAIPQDVKSQKKAFCNADNVTCTVIQCQSNQIRMNKPIKINFNLQFDRHVLAEILSVYDLEVISKAELKGLGNIRASDNLPDFTTCSTILIGPLPKPFIATWIWVVPTLCGLLLVAILVIVLYKCNFFQRKKFLQENPEEWEEVDFYDSAS